MAHQFKGFRATKPVARLSDKSKGIWEAFFIVYTPDGKKIMRRIKEGINSQPLKLRKAEAEETARALWEALQTGWDPTVQKYPKFDTQILLDCPNFITTLQHALRLKLPNLSKFSAYDYQGAVRFFSEAATRTGHAQVRIDRIERKDIRAIVAEAKAARKWSAGARNKYLSLLRSLLSVACDEMEVVKYNPAAGIKNEPQGETIGYKRIDTDQKEKIAAYVLKAAPAFFEYLMMIYDDGVRRKETLMIRIKDIDLNRREIRIRAEVSKTNRERVVPVTPTIQALLEAREVAKLPKEWYLFSNNKFNPGPDPYHPNTPTTWWRKLVQEDLGIDCKMYALKHTGGDDKIKAGIPLDALRTLYGHRSILMTEIYARSVREQYSQQIIDKAPDFAK